MHATDDAATHLPHGAPLAELVTCSLLPGHTAAPRARRLWGGGGAQCGGRRGAQPEARTASLP